MHKKLGNWSRIPYIVVMNKWPLLESVTVQPATNPSASVIWLHGLGADGHDFSDIVPALDLPNDCPIRFIFPHAPIRPVAINFNMEMRAWYDIYSLTTDEKEDLAGIQASEQSIHQLIETEIEKGIEPKRIILAGFSQGGAMALFTGLRYPQTLGGIMSLSSYLPFRNQINTTRNTVNQHTPIFIAHGKFDSVLPIQLGHNTYELLKTLDYPVEWHEYNMEHQVCPEEIDAISAWLIQVVQSQSSR